jgi:hypothetical protein
MYGRRQTRIIIRQVLYEHIDSVLDAAKIAALHHACSQFLRQATAFDPTASVDSRDRAARRSSTGLRRHTEATTTVADHLLPKHAPVSCST